MKEKKDKQTDKDGGTITAATANPVEGEDLSAMDEDNSHSGAGMMAGKHRFDQLIKTMIARIEYNNTLAPVQEYGRHQTKALKKKNKNKAAKEDEGGEKAGKAPRKDFDDRFYDLDDNFIDDGDMEDAYGAGFDGLGGPGGFDQFNEDFYGDLDADMTTSNQQ